MIFPPSFFRWPNSLRGLNFWVRVLPICPAKCHALCSRASLHLADGNEARFLEDIKQAQKLAADHVDYFEEYGLCAHLFGVYHHGVGNYEKAEECFRRAIGVYEEIGRPREGGESHLHMGMLYKDMKRYEEADREIQSAMTLNAAHPDHRFEVRAVLELSKLNFSQGFFQRSLFFARRALECSRLAKLGIERAHCLTQMARIEFARDNHMDGRGFLTKAYLEYRSRGLKRNIAALEQEFPDEIIL